MKKRSFAILLSLALMLTMISVPDQTAYAADPVTVTWKCANFPTNGTSYKKDGVTLNAKVVKHEQGMVGRLLGPGTFSAGADYNFTRIEIVSNNLPSYAFGEGWSGGAGALIWTGNSKQVKFSYSSDVGNPIHVETITFTLQSVDTDYDLWVGGTRVTSTNATDVLADDPINRGKVSFTPAWDNDPAILTLRGATLTTGRSADDNLYGICYEGSEPLTIVLESGTETKLEIDGYYGIYCRDPAADIAFSGVGSLVSKQPIYAQKSITFESGTVNVSATRSYSSAIYGKSVTIDGGSVTAKGVDYGVNGFEGVTISSGSVEATGTGSNSCGIYSIHNVVIDGGTVKASITGHSGAGIGTARGNITINGGSVTASAPVTNGKGIEPGENKSVIINGGKVTAIGGIKAISRTVKNKIVGTGWTNAEGTEEETAIVANEEPGHASLTYRNVQFPSPAAKVTKAPAARRLTVNGSPQELVTAGTAKGGEIQYVLGLDATTAPDTETYSRSIPTGTDIGDYFVWYKAFGDETHSDSDAVCVKVTIAAPVPADKTPVGSKHIVAGSTYVVSSAGTVSLVRARSKKSFILPATVNIKGKTFAVTGINAKALKGTKVRTLTVKTRKLTKASVKGSLKGSRVKTVKVKVGKKKENKKYVKKYRKIFKRKNCGKKVRVRR